MGELSATVTTIAAASNCTPPKPLSVDGEADRVTVKASSPSKTASTPWVLTVNWRVAGLAVLNTTWPLVAPVKSVASVARAAGLPPWARAQLRVISSVAPRAAPLRVTVNCAPPPSVMRAALTLRRKACAAVVEAAMVAVAAVAAASPNCTVPPPPPATESKVTVKSSAASAARSAARCTAMRPETAPAGMVRLPPPGSR